MGTKLWQTARVPTKDVLVVITGTIEHILLNDYRMLQQHVAIKIKKLY